MPTKKEVKPSDSKTPSKTSPKSEKSETQTPEKAKKQPVKPTNAGPVKASQSAKPTSDENSEKPDDLQKKDQKRGGPSGTPTNGSSAPSGRRVHWTQRLVKIR